VDDPLEVNRRWWDEAAIDHFERTYDLSRLRAGGEDLYAVEAAELPADLTGQRVCHLQCHIGTDTVSLARRGAEVVGVDFAPEAVARARRLAEELGASATFVASSVQDARAALDGEFDGVFTTWGTLVWLPSLPAWAAVVASLLRPGGWLYLADTHPYAAAIAFPDDPYGGSTPLRVESEGTYMDREVPREHTVTVEHSHGLGEIVSAVAGAGLRLDWLHEHDALPYDLGGLVRGDDRLWRRAGSDRPLSFSLRATKG
jgi:SAM-dependent methyltransferase